MIAKLDNPHILKGYQEKNAVFRKTVEILNRRKNINHAADIASGPLRARVNTLLNQGASLDKNGLLVTPRKYHQDKKFHSLIDIKQIKLPNSCAAEIAQALHNSLECSSMAAFKAAVRQIFDCQGIDAAINSMVQKCPGCMRLKKLTPIFRPAKQIPIPHRIGEQILVDTVHYFQPGTKDVKNCWRFLYATESLTRFSRLYPIRGELTANQIIEMMPQIKTDLASRLCSDTEIIIRCDQASAHISAAKSEKLKKMKIKIEPHSKTSASKNGIAELDGRLAQVNRIMRDILTDKNVTRTEAARRAAHKYNHLRGPEGFTANELFFASKQFTGESFLIPLNALIERIKLCREKSREARDFKIQNKRHRLPIKFVTYKPGEKYGIPTRSPLKEGDLIMIDQSFDKNQRRLFYKITEGQNFPGGIDWHNQLVNTVKVGCQTKKLYKFHFEAIAEVLDGRSIEEPSKLLESFLQENKNVNTQNNSPKQKFMAKKAQNLKILEGELPAGTPKRVLRPRNLVKENNQFEKEYFSNENDNLDEKTEFLNWKKCFHPAYTRCRKCYLNPNLQKIQARPFIPEKPVHINTKKSTLSKFEPGSVELLENISSDLSLDDNQIWPSIENFEASLNISSSDSEVFKTPEKNIQNNSKNFSNQKSSRSKRKRKVIKRFDMSPELILEGTKRKLRIVDPPTKIPTKTKKRSDSFRKGIFSTSSPNKKQSQNLAEVQPENIIKSGVRVRKKTETFQAEDFRISKNLIKPKF